MLINATDILLDHNGIIKYVDFGAAKVIARQGKTRGAATAAKTKLNSMTGTPMYMSPEGMNLITIPHGNPTKIDHSYHGHRWRTARQHRYMVSWLCCS